MGNWLRRFRGVALLWLGWITLAAQGGVVQTLDGQNLSGRLRLDAGGTISVVPANGQPLTIALSNLWRADFAGLTNSPPPLLRDRRHRAASDENNGALPAEWQSDDIGPLVKRSAVRHVRGTFAVEAQPRLGKGRGDALHFIHQVWQGDGEIVARVASLEPRDEKEKQARAGVMMRTGLEPTSANVAMSISGGLGSIFRRFSRKGEKVIDDKRPDLKPPYWVKLTRENGTIAGYQSTDSKNWKLVGSSETDLPPRMLVGLAVSGRRKESALATFDHVAIRSALPRSAFTPRIVLRDGTVIADHFTAMDESEIQFSKEKQGLKVRTADVGRLLFQPLFEADSLTPGRVGILLSSGDFIDGEFRGIEDGHVKISSVLLGQRTYDLNRKVAAMVLRNVAPRPALFEVATKEGSVWRPRTLTLEADGLRLDEPLAGLWRISAPELLEIRRPARP
jgi:hypothetical protein